jgi:hypothetical protein
MKTNRTPSPFFYIREQNSTALRSPVLLWACGLGQDLLQNIVLNFVAKWIQLQAEWLSLKRVLNELGHLVDPSESPRYKHHCRNREEPAAWLIHEYNGQCYQEERKQPGGVSRVGQRHPGSGNALARAELTNEITDTCLQQEALYRHAAITFGSRFLSFTNSIMNPLPQCQ